MPGASFEIDRLDAAPGQKPQDLRLSGPRAPVEQHHTAAEILVVEARLHAAAIRLVAARQHRRPPADLRQNRRHGPRALAAAPAVDQRPERAGLAGERAFEVACDISRDERGADPARQKP